MFINIKAVEIEVIEKNTKNDVCDIDTLMSIFAKTEQRIVINNKKQFVANLIRNIFSHEHKPVRAPVNGINVKIHKMPQKPKRLNLLSSYLKIGPKIQTIDERLLVENFTENIIGHTH